MKFLTTLLIATTLSSISQAMDPDNRPSSQPTDSTSLMTEFNQTTTLESAMDFIVQHNPDIATFLSSPDLYRPYIQHLHELSTNSTSNLHNIIKSRLPKKLILTLVDTDRTDRYDLRRDNTENAHEFISVIQNPEYTPTIHSNEQRQKTREAETAVIREYLANNNPSESDFQNAISEINAYLAKSHSKLPYDRDYDGTMNLIFDFIHHCAAHQETTIQTTKAVETLLNSSWSSITKRAASSRARFDATALEQKYQDSIFHILMMYMNIPNMKKSEKLEAASGLIFAHVTNNQHIQHFLKMIFRDVTDTPQEPQASSSNSGE